MPDLIGSIQYVFPAKTVAIIGDLVADQFLSGTISRVSREAPVFIMRHEDTTTLPGGAANAAANVAALGGKALAVGIVGSDENGGRLMAALDEAGVDTGGVIVGNGLTTTTKVRVIAGQQFAAKNQVIRIDYEGDRQLPAPVIEQLRQNAAAAARVADVMVLSDYNYGVVTSDIFDEVLSIAKERSVPVLVDSRFRLENFRGATSATPNREEVEQILGPNFTEADCEHLRERLGLESLVVTNGNKGMSVFASGTAPTSIAAIGSPTAVDVTGAGDTVIATYGLGLAAGLSFIDSAKVANHAGGIVVMKKRTATLTPSELVDSVRTDPGSAMSNEAR